MVCRIDCCFCTVCNLCVTAEAICIAGVSLCVTVCCYCLTYFCAAVVGCRIDCCFCTVCNLCITAETICIAGVSLCVAVCCYCLTYFCSAVVVICVNSTVCFMTFITDLCGGTCCRSTGMCLSNSHRTSCTYALVIVIVSLCPCVNIVTESRTRIVRYLLISAILTSFCCIRIGKTSCFCRYRCAVIMSYFCICCRANSTGS